MNQNLLILNTSFLPVYRQCRRFIADGPVPWASDIGSVVRGIVEGGSVVVSGIMASGSDEK